MKFGLALAPHHKVFGAFAIYSFTMGNIFPRFADLRHTMGVEEGAFGFGLIGAPVGTLISLTFAPPLLEKTERDGTRLRVRVRDAASPIREAVYSVDASEWKPALPADGLLDGKTETLTIEPGKDGKTASGGLLLLRVTDAAFNVTTFNLTQQR